MSASFVRNGFPRWAGFVLVALTWAFSPSTARAECGDYVHIPTLAGEPALQPKPDRHRPCHGPNCKKLPDRAPLLPISAPTVSVQEFACLSSVAPMPELGRTNYPTYLDPFTGESHISRLERPPRS